MIPMGLCCPFFFDAQGSGSLLPEFTGKGAHVLDGFDFIYNLDAD